MTLKTSFQDPERESGRETAAERSAGATGVTVMTSGEPDDSPLTADRFTIAIESGASVTAGRIREASFPPGERKGTRLAGDSGMTAPNNAASAGVPFSLGRDWISEIRIWEFERSRRGKVRGVQTLLGNPIPAWKRAMDILGASLGLLVLLPLFLAIAVFIKTVSPGPVFFSQKRVGYRGKLFNIWKFRTMRVDADAALHQEHVREFIRNHPNDAMVKIGNDPRIIPFGKLLRKTAIDELPQLFNVLVGDMSMVGPRPELPYAAQAYEPWPTRRFDVVPGMTGLWQVSGKNKTTYHEMMRLDIRYVLKRTFMLDIKIILKTFPVLIAQVVEKSKGA